MPIKRTLDDLKKVLKEKYPHIKVFKSEYVNTKTKMQFKCKVHNTVFETTPEMFFTGRRKGCLLCGRESELASRHEKSYENYVSLLKQNYSDITLKIKRSDWKGRRTEYIHHCKIHGDFFKTPNMVLDTSYGCNECTKEKSITLRYDTEQYKKVLKKHWGDKYAVVGEYVDTLTPILHYCTKHKIEFLKVPNALKQRGCPKCAREGRLKKNSISNKDFRKRLKKAHKGKIVALSKYRNHKKPVLFLCKECDYQWKSYPWNKIRDLKSTGCPKCARIKQNENRPPQSKDEIKLKRFVRKYFPNAESKWVSDPYNNKTLREYDIFIPELKLAIEYNGNYWHSYPIKSANYHYKKRKLAEACGIRLISVWEADWLNRKRQVKSLLKNALNVPRARVYARKCEIRVKRKMTNKIKRFYDKYHIQGSVKRGITFCLYYENKLVACMTFDSIQSVRGSRKKKGCYELVRLASKCNVIGGASKLFAGFKKECKPESVITYCDLDYFTGETYNKLGFEKTGKECYTYFTVMGNVRRHKSYTRRKNLPFLLKHFDPVLSERENLVKNKVPICYTSGKQKYIWREK